MSACKKTQTIVFPFAYNDVFNATIDAARNAGMKVGNTNINAGTIGLSKSMSLWSWGETITVQLRPVQDYVTEACITSDSDMPTTLIDWGVNNKNIKKIADGVNSILSAYYRN